MKPHAPLSPQQSAVFGMGRGLIVFDTWARSGNEALDFERAALIDFALQHPQPLSAIVPQVEPIIRAHDLHRHDLGGLFAKRHYGSIRERFSSVISNLVARDLIEMVPADEDDEVQRFAITDLGREAAGTFRTGLSIGLRMLGAMLAEAWARKNVRELAKQIRDELPDQSQLIAALGEPFAEWLEETAT